MERYTKFLLFKQQVLVDKECNVYRELSQEGE